MRVALFGGTFDPPHRGHLAVARAAGSKLSLDEILFAPTARQPLKPRGPSASFADRLAMVRLLCAAEQNGSQCVRLLASEIDGPREDGQPNYTIDTLRRLREELQNTYPDEKIDLFVILGADAFLGLRRWREPDALLESADWIVVSRPGFSLISLAPLALTPEQRERVHLLENVHEPVSASEVRDRLRAGLDCSSLLTPEVLGYIREHGLYLSGA
jgi:nicotinate-nucleotide adenylyltransferase